MEENQNNDHISKESQNNNDITPKIKPYVMRNFIKELKRVRWPTDKQHNKNFLYIFIFIILLTGFFALVSLGATELIKLIGAK